MAAEMHAIFELAIYFINRVLRFKYGLNNISSINYLELISGVKIIYNEQAAMKF